MSDDGFLRRWSARKQSSRRGSATPVAPVTERADVAEPSGDPAPIAVETLIQPEHNAGSLVPVGDPSVPDDAAMPEADLRGQAEAAGLPAVEDLDAASDYTGFLGQGVPEALAKAALRKLWLSDPVFANLDGLNDYDEDYNVIDKILHLAESGKDLGKVADSGDPEAESVPEAPEPEPQATASTDSDDEPVDGPDEPRDEAADDPAEEDGGTRVT